MLSGMKDKLPDDYLRNWRKSRDISCATLDEVLGISVPTLRRWETANDIPVTRVASVRRILASFKK